MSVLDLGKAMIDTRMVNRTGAEDHRHQSVRFDPCFSLLAMLERFSLFALLNRVPTDCLNNRR